MTGSVGHVQFKNFTFKKTLQLLFMDGVQLLIFNTRSLGLPVAHLVEPPNCFQPKTPGLGIQHLDH